MRTGKQTWLGLALEDRMDRTGDCWIFLGWKDKQGYGRLYAEGRHWSAHRLAYHRWVGPIGDMQVLHKCDNPPCCNPAHLFLGTARDNVHDCIAKGRSAIGRMVNGARRKISPDDVRAIRASSETASAMASQYGLSASSISLIRTGKRWKWV